MIGGKHQRAEVYFIMNKRVEEALSLLQEECAEVIVEISKCKRFGLDSKHYKTKVPHKKTLENELGDVLILVDILIEENIITEQNLIDAMAAKKEKLKKWSNLYNGNES